MIPISHPDIQNLAIKHYRSIKSHLEKRTKSVTYSDINQWFKENGDNRSFKDVILADVVELEHIKDVYKQTSNYPQEILFIRDNLYQTYFSTTKYLGSETTYNAWELIEKLGITVCPYCNRNFINNIDSKHSIRKRTSQIDHFYDKSQYPFLAMSFYNLVPSCPSCNLLKGVQEMSYNPYDSRFTINDLFNFEIEIESATYLYDNKFQIKLNEITPGIVKENIKALNLDMQYSLHKDIVVEQILKKRIYTKEKMDELKNDYPDLIHSDEELNRILFGNYVNEEDFYKRPLSKLMKDIIQEEYK